MKVDMSLNKETKPNIYAYMYTYICVYASETNLHINWVKKQNRILADVFHSRQALTIRKLFLYLNEDPCQIQICIYEVPSISFQTFFVWALLLIVLTWNSSPLRMHLLYCSNNFWKAPWKSSCVSVSMTFVTASFISSIVS